MCFKSPHRQSSKLQICTSLHKTKQRKKKEKEQKHSQSFTRPSSKFLKTNFCQSIFNCRSKNSMVKGISVKTKKKRIRDRRERKAMSYRSRVTRGKGKTKGATTRERDHVARVHGARCNLSSRINRRAVSRGAIN